MKKHLCIFAALLAVSLWSCTNDDIPVQQSVTVKINPSTVVSSLLEYTAGDLSSLDRDYFLYVSLYVYNEAGTLVSSDVQKFSDYTHIMNSVQNLEAGDYTFVASTHVKSESDFKYWDFTGQDNLSTFTVTDKGYIGGSYKILGLSAQKISISPATKDIAMDVECSGAVALVRVMNWNRYKNVTKFGLYGNKSCDNIMFDYTAQLAYSIQTDNSGGYWMSLWDYDSAYSGGYGYTYMFPISNIHMSFAAETSSNTIMDLGTSITTDIKKGHTYYFTYDVTSEETKWQEATRSGDPVESALVEEKSQDNHLSLQYNRESQCITIAL